MSQFRKLISITMLLATSKNQTVSLQEIVSSKAIGDWRREQHSLDEVHNYLPLYDAMLPSPPLDSMVPSPPLDSMVPKIPLFPQVDVIYTAYHPPELIHPIRLDTKLVPPPMYRMEPPPELFLPLPPDMPPPHHFLLPFSVPATKSKSKTSYGSYNMASIDQFEKTKATTPMNISFENTRQPNDSVPSKTLDPSKTKNEFSAVNFSLQNPTAHKNHSHHNIVEEQIKKHPVIFPLSILFSEVTDPPKHSLLFGFYYPKTRNSFPSSDSSLPDSVLNTTNIVRESVPVDLTERTPEPTPSLFFSGIYRTEPLFFRPAGPSEQRNFSMFNTPVRNIETDVVNTWKHSNMFSFLPKSRISQTSYINQNADPDDSVTVPSILESTERGKLKIYPQNLITKKSMVRIIPLKKGTVLKNIGTLKLVKGQGRFGSLVRTLSHRYDGNATFRRVLDFRQSLK